MDPSGLLKNPLQHLEKLDKDYEDITEAQKVLKALEKSMLEVRTKVEYLIKLSKQAISDRNTELIKKNINELGFTKNFQDIPRIFAILEPYLKPQISSSTKTLTTINFQTKKVNLLNSKLMFSDDYLQIVKDSAFEKLMNFRNSYRPPKNSAPVLEYVTFLSELRFFCQKNGHILMRFNPSHDYSNLPSHFYYTIVRKDLRTLTICCLKKQGKFGMDLIAINDIVYSHLFDHEPSKITGTCQNMYIDKMENDIELHDLLKMIKKNLNRVTLPCLSPALSIHQMHSLICMDKLENYYGQNVVKFNGKEKDFITKIYIENCFKKFVDELNEALEKNCVLCLKKFAKEGPNNKLIPCMVTRQERGVYHVACKKNLEVREIDEPKIKIQIEINDLHTFQQIRQSLSISILLYCYVLNREDSIDLLFYSCMIYIAYQSQTEQNKNS